MNTHTCIEPLENRKSARPARSCARSRARSQTPFGNAVEERNSISHGGGVCGQVTATRHEAQLPHDACVPKAPLWEREGFIEPLENRIAPASFTYADVDGDLVKITTSKGTDAELATAAPVLLGQLEELDLSAATWGDTFSHSSVSIRVIEVNPVSGDGTVNVGQINAEGVDLGAVKVGGVRVGGDIGRIVAGDPTPGGTGVLSSRSIRSASSARTPARRIWKA